MSDGKIPQSSKISVDNIIKPSFDELSEDQRQAFGALKKQRQKEVEALLRKKEEEDTEVFLASFKKDRQGTITSTGEVKLPPLLSKPTEPSVSTSQFSDDQMFEVDRRISDASQLNWNAMLEYIKASKTRLVLLLVMLVQILK